MKNPWLDFNPAENAPRFHREDLDYVEAFNKGMKKQEFQIAEHLEPFPFLGSPSAPVLVLLANPGVNDDERRKNYRMNPTTLEQNRRNLLHGDLDSFRSRINSPNEPHLESVWLKPRIRKLVEATSVDRVSTGVFLVNFHAYHSKSWYPIPFTFPTQRYSFHLVAEAVHRDAIIIMSRNMLGWFTAVPQLFDHKNRFNFESSRSVHISEGNLGRKAFRAIIERI